MNYSRTFYRKHAKKASVFFTLLFLSELFAPTAALALTGGPTQPEMSSFEPISTNQMVDLFTGDFTYNIPLMDVGGYPINIAYHAGVGMEQEASWVGLGWNINPGVINRTVRGVPDDFNGDLIETSMHRKEDITVNAKGGLDKEIIGLKLEKLGKLNLSLGMSFTYNTYRGFYMAPDFGLNFNASVGDIFGGQVGINHSADGGIGMYAAPTMKLGNDKFAGSISPTVSYNARNQSIGLSVNTGIALSESKEAAEKGESKHNTKRMEKFSKAIKKIAKGKNAKVREFTDYEMKSLNMSGSGSIQFGSSSYIPSSAPSMSNEFGSIRGAIGLEVQSAHPAAYVEGNYMKQSLANTSITDGAYGYLFLHERPKKNGQFEGIADFNRDGPSGSFNPAVKYLSPSTMTYDILSVNAHGTGGMYRPFRNDVGVVSDPYYEYNSVNGLSLGFEIGAGSIARIGGDAVVRSSQDRGGNWLDPQLTEYEFKPKVKGRLEENVYYKVAGEIVPITETYKAFGYDEVKSYYTKSKNSLHEPGLQVDKWVKYETSHDISPRQPRGKVVTILNGAEASFVGLDKKIRSVSGKDYDNLTEFEYSRETNSEDYHTSEITQYEKDGSRYVFGIPAMNRTKEEYLFSIDGQSNPRAISTVQYSQTDATTGNLKGLDNYFSKKVTPEYAHSFLLTGYLSPDYMDVTGDGITDDDIGTAVKFNWTKVHDSFGWRTPIGGYKANYAAGNEGDKNDDKASFVHGTKELWYLHSIESSHYVAVFETDDFRTDATSVRLHGALEPLKKSKRLKRIVLYAKSNLDKPLKTVEFEYTQELCQGIPNGTGGTSGNNGKLTLKKISFKFGESSGAAFAPYEFTYNEQYVKNSSSIPVNGDYNPEQVDRWGNFKGHNIPESSTSKLSKNEYPYTNQEVAKDVADSWASLWNLSKIKLPSGGEITIDYESDDYGWVQDQPAMEMIRVKGAGSTEKWSSATNKLYHGNGNSQNYYLYFELPFDVNNLPQGYTKELAFKNMFKSFDLKKNQLYYKFYVKVVDGVAEHNGITGYATVETHNNELVMGICPDDSKYGYIKVKPTRAGGKINKHWVNPIAANAMQYFTNYMPTYVKPGADKGAPQGDFLAIAKKMVTIIPDLLQMVVGPVRYMMINGVASEFSNTASLIRVNSWDNQKFGGGYRVAKVEISDSWDDMTGNEFESTYGQEYSYLNEDGTTSGVASFEPLLGGEENPLRYPTKFMQKKNPGVSPNWELFQETPLGETFYPSPVVGYERVVVKNIHADKPSSKYYKETRFYTAKDFPVYFKNSDISVKEPNKLIGKLKPPVGTWTTKAHFSAAQGFVFYLNDMHGKMKSESHYSVLGNGTNKVKLSGTEYIYYTERDKEEGREVLHNKVRAVLRNGKIGEIMLGKEIDLTIDSRDIYHNDKSQNIKGSLDVITLGIIPAFPLPMVLYLDENNETQVRTAVVTKIIQSHGLLHKVVTHDMNHQTTLTNELFDGHTGDLLVSRVNDPFGQDHITSLLPAYWNERYERMGHAYRNIGFEEMGGKEITILGPCADLDTDDPDAFDFLSYYFYEGIVDSYLENHKKVNSAYGKLNTIAGNLMTANVYVPGDEVLVMKDGVKEHLWVMNVLSPQDVEDLLAATPASEDCLSEVTGTPNGITSSDNSGTGNSGTNGNADPRCSNILTESAFKAGIVNASPGLTTGEVDKILGDLVNFDTDPSAEKICDLLDLFPLQSKDPSTFFTNYRLDDFAFLISDGNTFSAQYQLNNTGKLIKEILDDPSLHYFIGNYFPASQNNGALHDPNYIEFYETVLSDEQLTQYLKCTLDHPEILQFVSNLGCDQDAADLVRFSTYNWYKCFEKDPNQYTTLSELWDCDDVAIGPPGSVLDPVIGLNSTTGSSGGNVPGGVSTDPKTIMGVLNQTQTNPGANTTSSANTPNTQGTNETVLCEITCPSDKIETADAGNCDKNIIIPPLNYSGQDCTNPVITNDKTGTTNASGSYPVGTTVVTWAVTYNGNTTTCIQNVTVNPNPAPAIACSPKNENNDPGMCSAVVNLNPVVTDACDSTIITNDYTNDDQTIATFPVGTTMVTWTVTQGTNTSTCVQTVTVKDSEPPIVHQWPPDEVRYADPGRQDAYIQIGQPIASDNCNVTFTNSRNGTSDATDHYTIGSHSVFWTVSDGVNSVPAPAIQTIVVQEDPNPHALCKDITVNLRGKTSVQVDPMDVDDGSWYHVGPLTSYSLNPNTFDKNNIGPNVAYLTVSDGIKSDACSSIITVIDIDDFDTKDDTIDYEDIIDWKNNPPCSGATGVFSVGTYTDVTPGSCSYDYVNYFHNNSLQAEYWLYSLDRGQVNPVVHHSFNNCSSHEYVECDYSFEYTNTVNPIDEGHNNSLTTGHANSGTPPPSSSLNVCCFFKHQKFDMYGKEIVIFIDRYGNIKSVEDKDVKIIRSGRRNVVDAKVAEIVSVGTGPFVDDFKNQTKRTEYYSQNKVIRASTNTFSDYWKTDRQFVRTQTDINMSVNPFVHGIRGNFKPYQSYYSNSNRIESEDMTEAGKLKDFLPFWEFAGSMNKIAPTQASVDDWLLSSQITAYSAMHGAPLEQYVSLDQSGANNIYSAEVIGGHGKVSAVGSNMEKREIFYADFERNSYQNTYELEHIKDWHISTSNKLSSVTAHTGKYSLYAEPLSYEYSSDMDLSLYPPETVPPNYIGPSSTASSPFSIAIPKIDQGILVHKYDVKYLSTGYSPNESEKYIVSGWIKEGFNQDWIYRDPATNIEQTMQYHTLARLDVDGNDVLIDILDAPFVEGWQRFYAEVDLDPSDGILIRFYGGKYGAYLDDLRIFPVDGTMKSFVYDDTYQRLQAELDENNYATFYDYDHEGNLIRVRKETERGILTLQESYKHTHNPNP
jgi:hypothetical protein